ncbi:phytanoyl-CoA dioxygenase family protein [Acinetobacter chinensis]|uniref:Phytanoyl-CoA dioxygenase family protein n=1 Tax=Acinetobacter chinensis TaxID=2004650 RepID=A0ABU3WFA7_9GAMM|nr:phytanoyl-CoA dioxygenase family protein [Acinetobacter chinensis]MDV2469090.1 phytanoyl-CoA dioxygenase family protein [Acinetobacter chinensis]
MSSERKIKEMENPGYNSVRLIMNKNGTALDQSKFKQIKAELSADGIVKLSQFIAKKEVNLIRQSLMSELKRLKIYENNKIISKELKNLSHFQQIVMLSKVVKQPKALENYSDIFGEILFKIFAEKFHFDQQQQLLLTLPQQEKWTLNDLKWHVDSHSTAFESLQFFLLIDDIQTHGGGTLVLKGSHHLSERLSLSQLNNLLSLKNLNQPFDFQNKKLEIIELTGVEGDVYLMDMRVVHSPAINAAKKIRMMATYRYFQNI